MSMTPKAAHTRISKFKTVKGLVKFLEREGITGQNRSPVNCPIRNWYAKVLGIEENLLYRGEGSKLMAVSVTYREVRGFHQDGSELFEYTNSPTVSEFIHEFDNGGHASLRKAE